ncbi:hypothetical protein AB0C04_26770 [Micromonospora sp. NPDC048909]|uniref:hypothetical protein n=1 Tax=Micromonospora sp. NPDC048909 TaxID=3155643 RepID=UPI00340D4B39
MSEEWLTYLRWAAAQAYGRGIEPDRVEMAVFHDRWPLPEPEAADKTDSGVHLPGGW